MIDAPLQLIHLSFKPRVFGHSFRLALAHLFSLGLQLGLCFKFGFGFLNLCLGCQNLWLQIVEVGLRSFSLARSFLERFELLLQAGSDGVDHI